MALHDDRFWRVRSSVMANAASVLGDEFSVTAVAITLALPRHEVAHALGQMAAVGWICRVGSSDTRNPDHGPWYEPGAKWAWLVARRFSNYDGEMEVDLALADALQVARSRNRTWAMFDCLVTELWAAPASAKAKPPRARTLELAVACCARPGRPVRQSNSLEPHSTAWEQTRAAFKTRNSALNARDLPALANSTRLRPLYRASSDFELWFATPETVQEFPTAFLDCTREWSAAPEQFVELRGYASDKDIERLRGVAMETATRTVEGR